MAAFYLLQLVFALIPILLVGWLVVTLSSIKHDQRRIADALERIERTSADRLPGRLPLDRR